MKLFTTASTLLFNISTAAAQTTTPDDESMVLIQSLGLKEDELPKPGYNMEGGSVFDNYVKARRDGQFFLVANLLAQYEKPSSEPIEAKGLRWCSNLHFTNNSSNGTYSRGVGYTAHCVNAKVGDFPSKFDSAGAQVTSSLVADEFSSTHSLSASFNAQANMFNVAAHSNTDNYVYLYTDVGLPIMCYLGWEVHDEGDLHPNADTSSLSATGQMTWVSSEEAALLLNNNASDFTPETFDEIYKKVWNDHHAFAAAAQQTTATTNNESSTSEEEERMRAMATMRRTL